MRIAATLACAALGLTPMRAGAQGSITGTVYDSLTARAPLANATVMLVEQSRTATTDPRGRFRFDSVPSGRYTLRFKHRVLDSIDVQPPAVTVDVTEGRRATVTLSTPSRATVYKRICPGAYDAEIGVVIGRVRDVDDQSMLADAAVTTDWTALVRTGGHAASQPFRAAARSNAQGVYVLCGVPNTEPMDLHAELAGFRAGPSPLFLNDGLIGRLDFALSRRDSAARAVAPGDSAAIAAGASGSASLRGTVLGDEGRPMRDAIVSILGTQRSVHADAAGAFRIDHIPAGTRTIEVRYVGLLPMTVSMDFATNAARDTLLTIGRKAQALGPVAVKANATLPSWMERSGFEDRRKMGLGAFMTEEEIKRHTFPELITVLQGLRGVRVEFGHIPGAMGIPYMLSGGRRCTPNYFLDGTHFPNDFSQLTGLVPPERIKGIEAYNSPGTIAIEYDMIASTGCGSIVIWTR
jgi:hypothetical protein